MFLFQFSFDHLRELDLLLFLLLIGSDIFIFSIRPFKCPFKCPFLNVQVISSGSGGGGQQGEKNSSMSFWLFLIY
jgi:hypothetical protein